MKKKLLWLFIIISVALLNYTAAKVVRDVLLDMFPVLTPQIAVSLPWLFGTGLLALLWCKDSGLLLRWEEFILHKISLLKYVGTVLLGLVLFIAFGFTDYFNAVKFPIVFFIVTPIAEELLFRGWMYGQVQKWQLGSPIVISAILFGLHHLQYFSYGLSGFAIFQVMYTIALGLLFGKMRQLSGSIYLGILIHIIINAVTVLF